MFFLTIDFSVETLKNSAFVALIPIAILLIRFLWEVIGVVIDKLMKKDERRLIQSLDVELFESRERFYECYMSANACVVWWFLIGQAPLDVENTSPNSENEAWRFQFEGEEQIARLKKMMHEIKVRRDTVEYTFCGCTKEFSKITHFFCDALEDVAYYISKLYFTYHMDSESLASELSKLRTVKNNASNNNQNDASDNNQKGLYDALERVMNAYVGFFYNSKNKQIRATLEKIECYKEDGEFDVLDFLRTLRKDYEYLIKAYWQTIYSKGSLVLLNKKGFMNNSDDGLD